MRLGGGILGGFALAFGPSVAGAQAVETSLRPVLRPAAIEARFTNTVAPITSLRPKVRPTRTRSATGSAVEKVVVEQTIAADINAQKVTKTSPLKNVVARTETGVVTATSPFAVRTSLRPKKRPRKLKTALLDTSKPGRAQKVVRYKKKGSVCEINGLRGYSVKRIVGKGVLQLDAEKRETCSGPQGWRAGQGANHWWVCLSEPQQCENGAVV